MAFGKEEEVIPTHEEDSEQKDISKVATSNADKALQVLKLEGDRSYVLDDKINARVRSRIDMFLMPVMCFTYFLQYIDKTALSYSSIMGLETDTGLVDNQYSWLGTVFYFGYLAFEPVANRCMQYFPLGKWTAANCVAWGAVLACMAACHNFTSLVAVRVILGIFEASISPGFILLTSQYYKKHEQAGRMGVWFAANGLAQTIGGCLAYGIAVNTAGNQTAIASWQILFLAVGIITSLWGCCLFVLIPDDPLHAWFLSVDDRIYAVERIRGNQQGIGNRHFKMAQFWETLRDPLTWTYLVFQLLSSVPQAGLTSFFAIVIKNFGFTSQQALLYGSPSGAFFLGSVLILTFLGDWVHQRLYCAIFARIVAIVGSILLVALPASDKLGRLFGYYLTQVDAAPNILMWTLLGTNIAGYTKKVTTNALVFVVYALGFIIGPQTFRASNAPDYTPAKIIIIAFWTFSGFMLVIMRVIYSRRNAAKARERSSPGYERLQNCEFLDLTDRTNPEFTYVL